jgi:hypothetical protein
MKSKLIFHTIISLLITIFATHQIRAQGIGITSGGHIKVVGNATIQINNGNFENNGTYTKGTETFTFSGTTEKIITGNDLDLYHMVVTNTGGVITQIDLLTTNNLDIANTGRFKINPGKSVTVSNTLTNNAGSSGLVIKSDATGTGSLIHFTENVPATVERFVTGNKWHYMFAPLSDIPTSVYTTEGSYTNYNLYSYNESTADYWDATVTYGTSGWTPEYDNTNLPTSKGYIYNRYAMPDNTFSQTGGNLFAGGKTFDVNYNTGTGEIGNGVLQGWDNFDGWNLIGNPYPSAIDWDLISKDDIEAGVYFFDGVNYRYYVFGGGSSVWDVGITLNGGSNFIPAGQGFFVKVKNTGSSHSGTFTIPQNAKVHNNVAFWKKSIADVPNIIKLNIIGEEFTDETLIRTIPGVTPENDPNYDAYKMFSWDKTKPQLFSFNSDTSTNFAVNAIPEIDSEQSVYLGLFIGTAGEYSINTTDFTFDLFNVWLEDKTENKISNVRASPSYPFYSEEGAYNGRFVLHFNINHPPVANVQNREMDEDTDLYLDVSTLFYDIDSSDVLTIDIAQLPEWITNNGLILSGTPTNSEVGVYTITLKATDLAGATTETEFTITVKNVNDAPEMAFPLPDYNALTGTELIIEIDENTFVDIDAGDVLTYSSVFPDWLNFNWLTLRYSGIPLEEGTENVTLTATDLAGASVTGDFDIYVVSTSSNRDDDVFEIKLYPNPSHGIFVVETQSDGKFDVRVTDMTGNLVKQYRNVTLDHFKIDLSNQTNGMYYIEVGSAGHRFKEKLLKY